MRRRIFTVLLTIVITLTVIGCGEKEPELTGKWIPEDVTVIDNSEVAFPLKLADSETGDSVIYIRE